VAGVVGVAQAAAILPGISRSGATIAAALFLGLARKDAFEFSFLLSVPIVLAAAVKEMLGFDYSVIGPGPIVVGVLLALAAGIGALMLLRRVVLGARLHWFAYYCAVAGLLTLVFVR
jgi:undecaprenyl-diphosphatase